ESIGVARIWLNPDNPRKRRRLLLATRDFESGPIRLDLPGPAPLNFSAYRTLFAIDTRFVSAVVPNDKVLQEHRVSVRQRYLFTEYASTPSHEPNGVLSAARLF